MIDRSVWYARGFWLRGLGDFDRKQRVSWGETGFAGDRAPFAMEGLVLLIKPADPYPWKDLLYASEERFTKMQKNVT